MSASCRPSFDDVSSAQLAACGVAIQNTARRFSAADAALWTARTGDLFYA